MTPDDIKRILRESKNDPTLVARDSDELDNIIKGVIQLEKKHLYGTGTTSANRRKEEIEKFLDRELANYIEGN